VPAEKSSPKAVEPAPKKSRKLLLIGAAVLVLAVGAGAAWFVLGGKGDGKDAEAAAATPGSIPAQARYFALEPVFVVNLASADGSSRYLQAEVQLMTRDPLAVLAIESHAPAIRARLLMLFSQQSADALLSRQGKEKLQAAALAEVRKLLVEETGKPAAEALLFTSFVMQ